MTKHIAQQFELPFGESFYLGLGSENGVREIRKIQALSFLSAEKTYLDLIRKEGIKKENYETVDVVGL